MSRQSRSDALEKLLLFDHKARGQLMLMMVVSGVLSRVFWELLSPSSDAFTSAQILLASATMLSVFLGRWLTYDLGDARTGETFRWTQPVYTRRDLIGRITSSAFVIGVAATPAAAETKLLNRRITTLLNSGRDLEAARLTQRVVAADYSLSPSIASTVTLPSVRSLSEVEGSSPAKLRFESHVLRIQLPILHFDYDGLVPVRGKLNLRSVTCSGNGANVTRFLFDPDGKPGNDVLFSYSDDLRTDAVIMRLQAEGSSAASAKHAKFLSVASVSHKIAVYNVYVSGLRQDLDQVLWDSVRFTNCEITCEGQHFELINVVFVNCSFQYAESVPAEAREQIAKGDGVPISYDFHGA